MNPKLRLVQSDHVFILSLLMLPASNICQIKQQNSQVAMLQIAE
jgi:hypothetical protein